MCVFLSLFHCGSLVIFEWVLFFHCGCFALFEWVYFLLREFPSVWGRWRYCMFSFLIGGALFCALSPCIINFVEEIFENKCERYSEYNVTKTNFVLFGCVFWCVRWNLNILNTLVINFGRMLSF